MTSMAEGFSVRPGTLAAGSTQVAALQGRCSSAGSVAAESLTGMAGAVADAGMSSALADAAAAAMRAFLDATAACEHVTQALAQSASTYQQSDDAITARIEAIKGMMP